MTRTSAPTMRRARETAFRVLYQADVAGGTLAEAWAIREREERPGKGARALVADLLAVLEARRDEVDAVLSECAERWTLERLAATDRAVMRSAVAELLGRPGTPARVVLDEAIEIAKRFGAADSGRFVNGVLDRAARRLRPGEF